MKRIMMLLVALVTLCVIAGCGSESVKPAEAPKEPVKKVEQIATEVPAKGIPVLMYHMVGPIKDNDAVIREDLFRAQMKFLKDKGYHPISLEQLYAYITKGSPVPVKAVVLTFDDGYPDTYSIVYPVMKEYNFPWTVFVNPSDVGQRLTWEQLKEMQANGVTVASHGYVHKEMEYMSNQQQMDNVLKAQAALKEKLGIDNPWFCYPYGSYNEYSRKALEAGHIKMAFAMTPHGWAHKGDNPYEVRRVWIGNEVDLANFEERLSTEHYKGK